MNTKTQKHKNTRSYLKIGVLLFGLSTLNFSCQKEDVSINETSNNSVSTNEIISYNDFINAKSVNKNLLQEAIGDLNSLKSSTHRSLENNTFVVDTTLIGNVQHESGYVSYTFRVVSDPEANLLQNIMLSQYADGTEMNYLIEYKTDVPVGEILNGTTNQHLTEYRVTKLIDPQLSYASRGLSGSWDCVDVVSITSGECSFTAGSDKKEYADHPGCYEPDQMTPRTFITITVTEECEFVGGGIGADTGSDTGGFTPIGGGPGGETGNPAAGDDDTPCEENGLTTTIDDGNGGCITGTGVVVELPERNNCIDLKEFTDIPLVKTRLNTLKNDGGNFEKGMRIDKNPNTGEYVPTPILSNTGAYREINLYPSGYTEVIVHTHPPTDVFSMFSGPDILEMGKVASLIEGVSASTVASVSITHILVTDGMTFALRFDDIASVTKLKNIYEDPEQKKKFNKRLLKLYKKDKNSLTGLGETDIYKQQRHLFAFLQEYNVNLSLYQADQSGGFITGWRKINKETLAKENCN
ncbi:hypothetical protein [Lacinutrix undariae]